MSTTGRGRLAYNALKSVRTFFGEVSRLIGTADNWLGSEAGWTPNATTVLRNMSTQVGLHPKWLPEVVDRWYTTKDHHVAAYVAVILLPRVEERPMDEPLITAGWVRSNEPAAYDRPPRWVSYAAMKCDTPLDAAFHDVSLDPVSDALGRLKQRFNAYPLFELQNSDDLVERILRPLLADAPGNAMAGTDVNEPEQSPGGDVVDAGGP